MRKCIGDNAVDAPFTTEETSMCSTNVKMVSLEQTLSSDDGPHNIGDPLFCEAFTALEVKAIVSVQTLSSRFFELISINARSYGPR